MQTVILLVLTFLAAARLTRLVTTDFITEPFRRWVGRRSYLLGELVECPWCAGFWVSAALVAVVDLAVSDVLAGVPGWLAFGTEALACSMTVGLLARLDDE